MLLGTAFTLVNFLGMIRNSDEYKDSRPFVWIATLIVGRIYVFLWLAYFNVGMGDWNVQLYNDELHDYIWSGGWITIKVIYIIGLIGGIILFKRDVNKTPPLVTVLCIASMYLALGVLVVQCIQMNKNGIAAMCFLYVLNIFMMAITLLKIKIQEWYSVKEHSVENYGKNAFIIKMNKFLMKAWAWPIVAILFMMPLLGIIIAVLVLFGQEPDAIVKAWTETADWTFSQRVAPQNLYYDEHYLCTVAAGGHRKIVKPLRMGERHGHKVIVNRQLMIANAFENVLEEKTPKMHRVIRNFYDKYGFPIADYIRTNKVACDITYIVMKPLEWLFLIVLYLVDVNPENRIVVQYMHRSTDKQ
ncbi:DUF6688 domain-containing protein [Butyrivibrio sp. LB2008]|uniref:DUF6688 domain-containing protein n=1 Tax=Butyrivibrio sp. LB2008 TaxID=1408305 RepID=UPI000686B283|nr:DUF6688 family protein [Butyrivibrio sp. LB2008]